MARPARVTRRPCGSATAPAPWRTLLAGACLASRPSAAEQPSTVRFHNVGREPLLLQFVQAPPYGKLELKARVMTGMFASQDTFEGHVFDVSKDGANGGGTRVEIKGAGDVYCAGLGRPVMCNAEWEQSLDQYRGEAWEGFSRRTKAECQAKLQKHPSDAAHFCNADYRKWHITQCKYEMTAEQFDKAYDPQLKKGVETYVSRPQAFRNFTEVGFEPRTIPAGLLQELRSFWLANRLKHSAPENHPKLDPALSGCQSDTWTLFLPEQLRERVYNEVRPIVAAWAGLDPEELVATALYGLRLYREGSILQMHIDKIHTHALSAILEVGHLGYGHPDTEVEHAESWPLSIYDHRGNLNSVQNRAGQLILYESATCAHGRPTPFPSREFANVFVHFAPKGWPLNYVVQEETRRQLERGEL